jgi:hypothetical protein
MDKSDKPGFELKDLPNALIGIFGIRTETELPFEVESRDRIFEIRKLSPHLELSISKSGDRKKATDKSFEDLLAYIKGANKSKKQYAMTAPVFEEKINNQWKTAFYIRDEKNLAPLPDDPSLSLVENKGRRVATVKFSGRAGSKDVEKFTLKLQNWMKAKGLSSVGTPKLAQYDPPFAIPILRRNEIQIEIK